MFRSDNKFVNSYFWAVASGVYDRTLWAIKSPVRILLLFPFHLLHTSYVTWLYSRVSSYIRTDFPLRRITYFCVLELRKKNRTSSQKVKNQLYIVIIKQLSDNKNLHHYIFVVTLIFLYNTQRTDILKIICILMHFMSHNQ